MIITYKAMSKQQFAHEAGISMRTLLQWLHQFENELAQAHQKKRDKILNPATIRILCKHFCVEPNNSTKIQNQPYKLKIMVENIKIIVKWADGTIEKVFAPYMPAIGDTITTPKAHGIINARHINCLTGQITIHANQDI